MQNYFWRGKENQDFCGVFGWPTYLKVETSLRGTHFPFQDAWAGGITRSRGNPLEEDSPLVLTGWASQDHSARSSFDGTHTCPWGERAMRRCFRDLRLEDTGAPRALTGWRSPFSTRLGADDGQRGRARSPVGPVWNLIHLQRPCPSNALSHHFPLFGTSDLCFSQFLFQRVYLALERRAGCALLFIWPLGTSDDCDSRLAFLKTSLDIYALKRTLSSFACTLNERSKCMASLPPPPPPPPCFVQLETSDQNQENRRLPAAPAQRPLVAARSTGSALGPSGRPARRANALRARLPPSSCSLLTAFSPPSVVTAASATERSSCAPSITELTGGPGEDVTAGWPLSWTRAVGGFSLPSSVLRMSVCPLFLYEKALQGLFKSTVKL